MNKERIYGDKTGTQWYWKPKNLRTQDDTEKIRKFQNNHERRLAANGIQFVSNADGTMCSYDQKS